MKHYFSAVVVAVLAFSTSSSAQTATRVFLDGIPTPVYFNDGDSFRVLAGMHKDSRARMSGFNTLESYGPVHMWGSWTADELARFATLGTMNARQGVWRCKSKRTRSGKLSKDGYGRILWDCPDLATDQIRKGLAHAMTVTKRPARKALVEAQKEAIANRRGMWAHGVPEFVMTSLHSGHEWRGKSKPYNRTIATSDGHSEKWRHNFRFTECQHVCIPAADYDVKRIVDIVKGMRLEKKLKTVLENYVDAELVAIVTEFAKTGQVGQYKDDSHRWPIESLLARYHAAGATSASQTLYSCMIYVEFKRRYGGTKASCLK